MYYLYRSLISYSLHLSHSLFCSFLFSFHIPFLLYFFKYVFPYRYLLTGQYNVSEDDALLFGVFHFLHKFDEYLPLRHRPGFLGQRIVEFIPTKLLKTKVLFFLLLLYQKIQCIITTRNIGKLYHAIKMHFFFFIYFCSFLYICRPNLSHLLFYIYIYTLKTFETWEQLLLDHLRDFCGKTYSVSECIPARAQVPFIHFLIPFLVPYLSFEYTAGLYYIY